MIEECTTIGVSRTDAPLKNSEILDVEYCFLLLGFLFIFRAVVPLCRENSKRIKLNSCGKKRKEATVKHYWEHVYIIQEPNVFYSNFSSVKFHENHGSFLIVNSYLHPFLDLEN